MARVVTDFESRYRAMHGRDPRYDGFFFTAVTSTGVYCRPSCPARKPKRPNVRFFATAAAAQEAGFRACKRCRPDAAPGSPAWHWRADTAGRAMRLIADGVVDRDGVAGLSQRLGFSERHLRRLLTEEVGAGPIALARAQRAQAARALIESTRLRFADVAFAAGFGSIRQFNDTIRDVFASTPTELRRRGSPRLTSVSPGAIELRLARRDPFDGAALLGFLSARAVRGVEEVVDGTYRRSLVLPHGSAVVDLTPQTGSVRCKLRLDDVRDVTAAVARCRRLFDLDADPSAIDELLGGSPLLRPLVRKRPGLRVPRCVESGELAIRAVLGQHRSVPAARALTGELVEHFGVPLDEPVGAVTHHFPAASTLAAAMPAALPGPHRERDVLHRLACKLADRTLVLDGGAELSDTDDQLRAVRGVTNWAAAYIAMRGLGDPDAFLATDPGVRRALRQLGQRSDPASASQLAESWRPWRSYGTVHLWTM
jgi:AraC family transcriptional regulator of adaptative response / DNA-3-methyladenine glycosylase II